MDRLKALFINEQGYELDCLPVLISTRSSKASNDLSCLNSNQSVLVIEQVHWLCSANHQFFLFYFQFTGHWAAPSRSCRQPFWPDGARRLSPPGWDYISGSLSGRERGAGPRLLSVSQTVSLVGSSWELPSTLAMNLFPGLCVAQEVPTFRSGFALKEIRSAFLPLGSSTAGCIPPRSCHQPFCTDGTGRHPPQWLGLCLST